MNTNYNQTTQTPEEDLKFFTYCCQCCNESPKPDIISSTPAIGGQYINMYNNPSDRKWLIESQEGNLMGVCSNTDELVKFKVIDDTYVVQIPSILKLKKELDNIPNPPIDKNFKVKGRFRK